MAERARWYRNYSPGVGFPLLLIFVGAIWLGRYYGYIPSAVPLIPWILVAIGVWILLVRLLARVMG